MKRLRKRAYAKAAGFTYKTSRPENWQLTNGRFGVSRTGKVSDALFIGVANILIKDSKESSTIRKYEGRQGEGKAIGRDHGNAEKF